MDFTKQLPRFLLVIIMSMGGMLFGIIFSHFSIQFEPNGMGWDKLSNFLGYIFVGFLGGLFVGIVTALTMNSMMLKHIFMASIALVLAMVVLISINIM